MATATALRWSAFRNIARALRAVARPGGPGLLERLRAMPRLVRATARGEYAGTSLSRLLLLAGAVAYVVSPVDLMPEALLGLLGLADDAVVVSWIATMVVNETEQFLAWEQQRDRTVPGQVVG